MKETLLKYFVGLYIVDLITKGYKKTQKKCTEKIQNIIKDNLDKPRLSLVMYVNKCLIQYSQDKSLLDFVLFTTNKELKRFISSNLEITNYQLIDILRLVFIPYAGGKLKNKDIQKKSLDSFDLKKFTSYFEPFLGGFSSVSNSIPKLIENGIVNIFLSDINPSLINLYRQVQKNYFQVQKHLASIDIEYLKTYGKEFPETREECEKWFTRIKEEFLTLEQSKKMNPRRAALFFYLIHTTQGGMLEFNQKTKLNKFTFCFDSKKFRKVPLLINKVSIYNKIFNLGNIKFSIRKFETVQKIIRKDSKSLVLFDPPYVKYEEVSSSDDFTNCSYNYGINDFNHRKLLNQIKRSKYSFIYYNNHNPHLEKFSINENYNYMKKNMTYRNGTTGKKSVEIIMFKNRV